MTTSEKVAYLKGLVEGMAIDQTTKEGKVLAAVLDILEDLALDVQDMECAVDELEEGLNVVSDDLAEVEDLLYEDDEEDEDEDEEDEELDFPEGTVFYDAICPKCGGTVTFAEDQLEIGSIECPDCGATLEFDFSEDEAAEE